MVDLELISRMALSLLFATLIGVERQWRHRTAGLKTNTLVAIGATAFAIVSSRGFGPTTNPAQVAGGIVMGVGFIGAGVILHNGSSVQGINSAALLWVTASMGLAIGIGYYQLAWLVLISVLIIQFLLHHVTNWIDYYSNHITTSITYQVFVSATPTATNNVCEVWKAFAAQPGIQITSYSEIKDGSKDGSPESILNVSFKLSDRRVPEVATLGRQFTEISGVNKAQWSQSASEN